MKGEKKTMDAETIFSVLKGASPHYTMEHARIMEAYGRDRGLTPFAEFSPMLFHNKDTGKYQISFKDHYSMVHRWAQERGGYRRTWRRLPANNGDVTVEVSIMSNRDYAIVLQACQYGANRDEEMKAYEHIAQATCTAKDYATKRLTGKTQEWFALKRATEAALIDCFGKEPAQARQIYGANTLTVEGARNALTALYPTKEPEALPSPEVIDGDYFDPVEDQEAIEETIPAAFPNPEAAIAWGYEQGAFEARQHAKHAYDKLKREAQPKTAEAMRDLWVADIQRRLAEDPRSEW